MATWSQFSTDHSRPTRHTTLGGLILGFGFLWSDLVCYALGVELGVLVDVIGGIVPGKDRS